MTRILIDMRLRLLRTLSKMKLRDYLGCAFVLSFFIFAVHTMLWVVDDIRLKNLDAGSELSALDEYGCPEAGQGRRGVVLSMAASQGNLPDTLVRYLSIWAAVRRVGTWPAVPQAALEQLRTTFANLSIPALEELAVRCNMSFLIEELQAAGTKGNLATLARKSAFGRKHVELVVVGEPLLQEDLMREWLKLKRASIFKPSLQERSRRELESASAYVYDMGVHRQVEFVALLAVEGAINVTSFFSQAMAMMRFRLTGLGAPLFVTVCDDYSWCEKHLHGVDVHLVRLRPHDPQAMALLSACNHSIFPFNPEGLAVASHTAAGTNFVYHFGNDRQRQDMLKFIAGVKPPWFQLNFE